MADLEIRLEEAVNRFEPHPDLPRVQALMCSAVGSDESPNHLAEEGYTITTFAGGGACCSSGGGPATQAYLGTPQALAVDASGNLYIACYEASSCGGGLLGGLPKVTSSGA